jgi:hypothetical protein
MELVGTNLLYSVLCILTIIRRLSDKLTFLLFKQYNTIRCNGIEDDERSLFTFHRDACFLRVVAVKGGNENMRFSTRDTLNGS